MDGAVEKPRSETSLPLPQQANLVPAVQAAVERTRNWLLQRQSGDGHWCGELEGDSILESEYVLLLAFLGRERSLRATKAARYLLRLQQPHGGWGQFPGAPLDISASVKAYFALKLTGHDPEADYMRAARLAIRAAGGADAVNSFTRFYLALLGQIEYRHCPAVPPEAMLLPSWAPINIYKISAWSRTILAPLSIMWAKRPARRLPADQGIHELFLREPAQWPELKSPGLPESPGWFSYTRLFRWLDGLLKTLERWRVRPLRARALKTAERWMTERFVESDGLGAIFPPMVWSIIALKSLGFADDSIELRYCHEQLEGLVIETDDTVRLQPCKSPVWDTALTLRALAAAGVPATHGGVERGVRWLLGKEITRYGDWARTVKAHPGGWCFEHFNAFYPDVDDTAMVLLALREQFSETWYDEHAQTPANHHDALHPGEQSGWLPALLASANSTRSGGAAVAVVQGKATNLAEARRRVALQEQVAAACQRAMHWVEALQNRDGGWGAFDRNNDSEFLCHVPFADHNAMIDPSSPDLAGRVLEAFGAWGLRVGDARVDRAIGYLRRTQESDGPWFGRWGVNYIYGAWQVLVGLRAVGVPAHDPLVSRAADWLESCQQSTGAWGESATTYAEPGLRGQGPPTASQTAWAVLGLIAAGRGHSPGVLRGVQYLLQTQAGDGAWAETEFTGTGFPQVFYLRYHLYPVYFPLLALGAWRTAMLDAPVSAPANYIGEMPS